MLPIRLKWYCTKSSLCYFWKLLEWHFLLPPGSRFDYFLIGTMSKSKTPRRRPIDNCIWLTDGHPAHWYQLVEPSFLIELQGGNVAVKIHDGNVVPSLEMSQALLPFLFHCWMSICKLYASFTGNTPWFRSRKQSLADSKWFYFNANSPRGSITEQAKHGRPSIHTTSMLIQSLPILLPCDIFHGMYANLPQLRSPCSDCAPDESNAIPN